MAVMGIGRPITLAEIRDFRKCVDDNGLQDLKSTGAFYTWNNKQRGEDRTSWQGSKNLSYKGRVQLVNSILMHIHSYWSSIFILPKSVMKDIIAGVQKFYMDWANQYKEIPSNCLGYSL
ncbi:hypothetical protein H5410_017612 [Solanum commersonii]|uniref:Uncharacterized protein n=1 Tax=Solanum commersonii TaxID=4109 RepID=A0A9J6A0V3_SOLCO|nr:hypothetical protein H5410_017612 [Solanum commersonii]